MPISNCQPSRLLDPGCWYEFTYWMTNSADPDHLSSEEANWLDLHCLQRQYPGSAGQGLKIESRRATGSHSAYTTLKAQISLYINIYCSGLALFTSSLYIVDCSILEKRRSWSDCLYTHAQSDLPLHCMYAKVPYYKWTNFILHDAT